MRPESSTKKRDSHVARLEQEISRLDLPDAPQRPDTVDLFAGQRREPLWKRLPRLYLPFFDLHDPASAWTSCSTQHHSPRQSAASLNTSN
jgi:hypothetical protein